MPLSDPAVVATKAGEVVTGFSKVETLAGSGEAMALLHGSDAAIDGRQKLDRKHAAVSHSRGRAAIVVDCLTIDELSLAFGRENVVHAALTAGGAARRIVTEAERLIRYRSGNCAS